MKRLITFLAVLTAVGNLRSQLQCPTYSLNNASGNYTLACNASPVVIDAVNTSTVPIFSYGVAPAKGCNVISTSGNTISLGFTLPGTYTIVSNSDPFSYCQVTQTVTIYSNALAPIVNVTPSSATVSCSNAGPVVTFSASSSSTNAAGVWYQDIPPSTVQPNSIVPLSPPGTSCTFSTSAIGSYIAVFTDNTTGCVSSSVVTVSNSSVTSAVYAYASPNAYLPCANNSVVLNAGLITSFGPTTFTWTNLTTSVSVFPPGGGYTVTTPGYYVIEAEDGVGCVSSQTLYIGTNTVSPIISIYGNNKVCKGTSSDLTATGALSYTWSTGANTSTVNVLPSSTTTYTVTGADYFCLGSSIITVSVDPTCSDVWPGDASSDGVANLLDILEIGLQSGSTGPARSFTSNAWNSYFANNWTGTITNGKNKCHADCNGDGVVNIADVNAVGLNWGLTHTFKLQNTEATNPELNIISDQPAVQKGKWGTASIYLGDATNNINNFYGIMFDVNHNNSYIEADSIYLEYLNSFINTGGTNIEFQKEVFSNSALYAASTRTDHSDVNGNGKIAILHFKAINTLTSNVTLSITINNVNKSSSSGNITGLTGSSTTVTLTASAIGINELNNFENRINIYPQPAKDILNINLSNYHEPTVQVKISDLNGRIVRSEELGVRSGKAEIETSELSNGVFILQLVSKSQVAQKRLIIAK